MNKRILIVDDEPSIRKVLRAHLQTFGHEVDTAANGTEAIVLLQETPVHLVVTDLKMPGTDGMELLQWVSTHQPGLPVILITAYGTVDSAVEAIKRGAFDYIAKPFDRNELHGVITKALATESANAQRITESDHKGRYAIIGQTPSMQDLYTLIEKIAPSPTTVLIHGESGTGKELVARALHENSPRQGQPFIQINCGAIPENLFEAELFGYERGAFTGAQTSKPGRFELAQGGTLFLDEVAELPKDMQVKILRALQERTIDRVGGVQPIHVDVRVIAATNVDLQAAIAEGSFRQDLYYRLNVVPLTLPALRDRAQDIPLLVEHFLDKFNRRLDKQVQRVAPDAVRALLAHSWPGNIRELENLMERTVLLTESDTIELSDLPELSPTAGPLAAQVSGEGMGLKEYVRVHTVQLERDRIQRVLQAEDGNVTRAAKQLGISRKSLQTKMKEYGLREDPA